MKYNIGILKQSIVKTTQMLSDSGVEVIFEGFSPRVEFDSRTKTPTRIVLPTIPDDADEELIEAIHGFLDHESAHILYSDYNDICDTSKDKAWHFLHNCVDDAFINKKIARDYPGCKFNINNAYSLIYKRDYFDPSFIKSEFDKNPEDMRVRYIMVWVANHMSTYYSEEIWDSRKFQDYYNDWDSTAPKELINSLKSCASKDDVKNVTDLLYDFLSESSLDKINDQNDEPAPSDVGESGEFTDTGSGDDIPLSFEGSLSDIIKNKTISFVENQDCFFWSDRMNEIVHIKELPHRDINYSHFDMECKSAGYYIRKQLERFLISRDRVFYVPGYKSGRLTGSQLFKLYSNNDNIFSRKTEVSAKNAAVTLLIDLSGSMSGNKVKIASASAYALADCLHNLKIPFECLGFYNDGAIDRSKIKDAADGWIEFLKTIDRNIENKVVNKKSISTTIIFKSFNETFSNINRMYLCHASKGVIGMLNNEDSTHVKVALERLSVRPENKKLLIVFSDGQPHFSEGNDNSCSMLKKLVSNAKSDYGVDVFGVGIQDSSVRRFYENNQVVSNLEELPNALFKTLSSSLSR